MPLIRAFPNGELSVGRDGRTVTGIAVPFDVPAVVNDGYGAYTEVFRRGAFTRTIAERGSRVKVLAQHNRQAMPIGRAILLREEPAGLYAEMKISQTAAGDEALELVRDGALDGLSIGFNDIRDERASDGTVIRTEVRLNEISVVPFAAYEGAVITGVRAESHTPNLNLARAELALIEATLTVKEDRR